MSKKIPLGVTILLIIFTALITFMSTFVAFDFWDKQEGADTGEKSELISKIEFVEEIFRELYINDIDDEQLIDAIIAGYVEGSGDKYATYFNKGEYEEFVNDNNAHLQGIGIHVVYNDDYDAIEVVNVMPDSPALAAGVMQGDMVVRVGDERVSDIGYYGALDLMRGEAGAYVQFTVARGVDYSEEVTFHIERGDVTEQTVVSRIYAEDPKIGIIRILQFDSGTPEQFVRAIESLTSKGAEKFVLDVRNNPGGDLTAICSVLDYLLPEGPIIRIAYKNGQMNTINSNANEFTKPMAVLINGSTASAGELFAAALKDYNKAKLIGERTYGKGTMQSVIRLADDSAISVSVALYYPPFSDNYEGVGVAPDIVAEMPQEFENVSLYKIQDKDDTQLQEAVKTLA